MCGILVLGTGKYMFEKRLRSVLIFSIFAMEWLMRGLTRQSSHLCMYQATPKGVENDRR